MDSAVYRTSPPTIPSTPNPKPTPRASQGRGSTSQKTQHSTPSAHGTLQSSNARHGKYITILRDFCSLIYPRNTGSQMPPPKVPAKRKAPVLAEDDNDTDLLFGDSPLTATPPKKTPARKRRQAKAVPSNPTRKSQRAMSRMATDDGILAPTS